jgi:hypothetical protein
MQTNIYIQLLGEGTKVYKPVLCSLIEENIYIVGDLENYDAEDEIWEFPPNTFVIVEEQKIGGKNILVAIRNANSRSHNEL